MSDKKRGMIRGLKVRLTVQEALVNVIRPISTKATLAPLNNCFLNYPAGF